MKKSLLLLAAGLSSATMFADKPASPSVIEDITVQFISPNSKYLVSNPYEKFNVIDLETGQRWDYVAELYDENGFETGDTYRVGSGNIASNNGIVLVSTKEPTNASYWQLGEWKTLPTKGLAAGARAVVDGITPDGSRICGSMELSLPGYTSETSLLPVVWTKEGEAYGDYKVLPAPLKDYSGRAPQTITAVWISDDGKTIAGQIKDWSGAICEPIIYTEGADGEWSYNMPMEKVFRPADVVYPPFPADLPYPPEFTDYMTAEEKAAYEAALDKYYETWDEADYPNEADFMTTEEINAYNQASDEWNAKAIVYNEQIEAFNNVWFAQLLKLPSFLYNSCYMDPQGKSILTSISIMTEGGDPGIGGFDPGIALSDSDIDIDDPGIGVDPGYGYDEWTQPCRIDIATGEYTLIGNEKNTVVWSVLEDGRITLGSTAASGVLYGFIEQPDGSVVSIHDYISAINPEYGTWMTENMTHDIETGWDPVSGEFTTTKMFIPGAPIANRDASIIVSWTSNMWDFDSDAEYFAYYFNLANGAGVGNITTDTVKAQTVGYEVYDVNGRLMLKVADKASITGLASGVYLVKAILSDGSSTAEKIAL